MPDYHRIIAEHFLWAKPSFRLSGHHVRFIRPDVPGSLIRMSRFDERPDLIDIKQPLRFCVRDYLGVSAGKVLS
jgi:hypothetical protein